MKITRMIPLRDGGFYAGDTPGDWVRCDEAWWVFSDDAYANVVLQETWALNYRGDGPHLIIKQSVPREYGPVLYGESDVGP